jgi:hypothetical protein
MKMRMRILRWVIARMRAQLISKASQTLRTHLRLTLKALAISLSLDDAYVEI